MSLLYSSSSSRVARVRLFALLAAWASLGAATAAHGQCPVSFAPAVNYASAGGPNAVALGDFNADGRLDMQIANQGANTVRCYLGTGTGTFTDNGAIGVGTGPVSISIGDFNGDGRPDFVTANSVSNNVSVRLGIGNGFTSGPVNYPVGSNPRSVAIGDFNGDGRADVAAVNLTGDSISALMGIGNGTFTSAIVTNVFSGPNSVAAGDFNGDGRSDLAVGTLSADFRSQLSNGNGTFGSLLFPVQGRLQSLAVGDFNGDGRADLVLAYQGASGYTDVQVGNGAGTFASVGRFSDAGLPISVAVGDFNGDGRLDFVAANSGSDNVSVRLASGNGFASATFDSPVGSNPRSVAVGDFNGDGRPDLAVANQDSNNVSVLLNTTPGNPLPVFTTQPVGQVVQAGASVSLTASANFTQGPTPYQWRRNGQPLSNGGNISGANTGTLTINPVSAADEAQYHVVAISSTCLGVQTEAASTTAVLAVTAPAATGACCQGTTCTVTTGAAACSGGGTYLGDGTTCAPIGRSGAMNACCQGDFNNSGAASVQDIFDFLAAYFAGCP